MKMQLNKVFQVSRLLAGAAAGRAAPAVAARRWFSVDASSDSHDDFKPKYKAEPVSDINKIFEQDISENSVFIYMKGIPQAPMCGFSNMACRVLDAYGVKYGSRNVLADQDVREGIKKFTSWPTIPQVFVKGEFIGGADILMNMHQAGELEKLLEPVIQEQQAAAAEKK